MSKPVRYWLPAIVWSALILAASSDLFSSSHTGSLLEWIVTAILGHPLPAPQFAMLHAITRKAAHLTEYGILGALVFRAMRGDRSGWSARWAAGAVLLATCLASLDEWHQTFVPSRTGTPVDVLIDAAGAAIAQILIRVAQVLFF